MSTQGFPRRFYPIRILLLLVLLCHVPPLRAEGEAPPTPHDTAMQEGIDILQRLLSENAQPGDAVRAAKAFATAHTHATEAGDTEAAVSADALVLWCKQRMTDADMEVYIEIRDDALAAAFVRVDEVRFPPTDAARIRRETEAFALRHPDKPWQTAARFFELEHRAPDTPEGKDAANQFQNHLEAARILSVPDADADALLRELLPPYAEATRTLHDATHAAAQAYLDVLERTMADTARRGEHETTSLVRNELRLVERGATLSTVDFTAAGRSPFITRVASAQGTYNTAILNAHQAHLRTLDTLAGTLREAGQDARLALLQARTEKARAALRALEQLAEHARVARDLAGAWDITLAGALNAYSFAWTFREDGTFTMTESYQFPRNTTNRTFPGRWTVGDGKITLTRDNSTHTGTIQLPLVGRRISGTWVGADFFQSWTETGSPETLRNARHTSTATGTRQAGR